MGWHMDDVDWWWMSITMVVFWGLIAAVIVSLLRNRDARSPVEDRDPLRVLDRRLADGDIAIEEYRERVDAIQHSRR